MMKIAVFALLAVCAFGYEKDGDVLVLHDSDIDQAIAEHEFLLVEFYAPWCGHCKSLAPEYAKAATTLSKLDKPISIAKVDATEEKEAGNKFGVRGYPTLKWFVNGKESEYNGGRTEAEIVNWIKKKTGPPCTEIASAENLASFKDSADVVVVVFAEKGSETFKAAEDAARATDDVAFGVVADAANKGTEEFPSIVLFKKFDEGRVVFSGEATSEAVLEFVQGNSLPLVSTFTQEGASKIFGSGIENHFLYFNDAAASSHEGLLAEMRAAAGDFKGKTLFVYVPASESRVMSYFGLTEADLPAATLVAMGAGDMKKYGFSGEINAAAIKEHVNKYHAGELKPTLKSEDVPENNNGPVVVVVGKNFNDVVLDSTKNVLLEFYAPWCGHCKSLAPTWESLGTKYANHNDIVIAKVDATANDIDHDGVNVRGFPTILFFAAGDKTPVTYEGGRDLADFVKFLEENVPSASGPGSADSHAHAEL